MYTLGYSFRPWTNPKAIADGASILDYVRETAEAFGIDRKIRYRHARRSARAGRASDARWTVEALHTTTGETVRFACGFLILCSGYYDYDAGYTPELAGRERFRRQASSTRSTGPRTSTTTGKRVVVIGSGATAVTLVPELAKRAAHVTMLQRSPTYIVSVPSRDKIADWMRAHLPEQVAHGAARWKNVLFGLGFYTFSRRFPERTKRFLIEQAAKKLAGSADVATHFTPSYKPWDQRLCLVPDADLFEAIREGRAEVVTDHIETFTETGIELRSGKHARRRRRSSRRPGSS